MNLHLALGKRFAVGKHRHGEGNAFVSGFVGVGVVALGGQKPQHGHGRVLIQRRGELSAVHGGELGPFGQKAVGRFDGRKGRASGREQGKQGRNQPHHGKHRNSLFMGGKLNFFAEKGKIFLDEGCLGSMTLLR